ncbi:uncharacterized protein LOC112592782 [Melanaphis sacchari]|uniref:uncharacterized protein LOC112592782 n=1 Tax=Melanaphis sacchari TaxID=742174 RepID=UPI000DC15776|nr:uncharacterized protein LOC112592782 [Melanaphis sacchari]
MLCDSGQSNIGFNVEKSIGQICNTDNIIDDNMNQESTCENIMCTDESILDNTYDIGVYVIKKKNQTFKMDDVLKEKLLRKTWIPNSFTGLYVQITKYKKRHFQKSWLDEFKWLTYSKYLNGAFCKNCVVFGPVSTIGKGSNLKVGQLLILPFRNWKSAKNVFLTHSNLQYHKLAMIKSSNFLLTFDGKKKLLIFKQELSYRGHKDYGRLNLNEPEHNDGNFRALLRFRARCGDGILKSHILKSGAKQMYTSLLIQNEIITLIGLTIQNYIIDKFSLCLRYVDDEQNEIREDFIKFVSVTDVSGKGLADTIKKKLLSFGIDLKNLRGQGYDGAAAMSGAFNGVLALL